MSGIRIREYSQHDLEGVLEVLRLALGESPLRRTPEQWAWKHELNPFGRSLVLVATADSRIVGVRAFMRWVLKTVEGATVECARAVDTATHPGYRRMGIFKDLTLAALDLARSTGIQLVFNTPNANSKPGYLKMGWTEVGPVGVLARPSWRLLQLRSRRATGNYVRGSSSVKSWPLDRPPIGLRTPRSSSYLKWRFESHPTARYATVSVDSTTAFLRSNDRHGRRELVVSDVIGDDPRAAYRAIAKASTADYIVAWHGRGSPERRAAVASGLVPIPRLTALTLIANSLGGVHAATAGIAAWDFSMGDLELL